MQSMSLRGGREHVRVVPPSRTCTSTKFVVAVAAKRVQTIEAHIIYSCYCSVFGSSCVDWQCMKAGRWVVFFVDQQRVAGAASLTLAPTQAQVNSSRSSIT